LARKTQSTNAHGLSSGLGEGRGPDENQMTQVHIEKQPLNASSSSTTHSYR